MARRGSFRPKSSIRLFGTVQQAQLWALVGHDKDLTQHAWEAAMHVAFQSSKQSLTSTELWRLLTLLYDFVVSALNTALFYFIISLQENKTNCVGCFTVEGQMMWLYYLK